MRSTWKYELLPAIAVLLVLSCLGYGSLLKSGQVPYSPHSDIVSMHLATKTVLYDSIQSGDGLPYWRNDQLSGVQAFTNPESQYAYPLHGLFYLVRPWLAVGPTLWIQFLAGALVLYFVGKVLGLGRWACLIMAVAQLFNFKLIAIAYAGFLPILPAATLFPLLFASVFYLAKHPGWKGTLLLAVSGALCLSTGGFQLLYYSTMFLAGFLLWQVVSRWRRGERAHARRVLGSVLGGTALSAGVTACLLVPLAAESSLLSRAGASYEFFLSGYSLGGGHLLNLLYPESFGRLFDATDLGSYLWEEVVYFGIIPLALAFVGAIRGWGRRFTPFLVLTFGVSLLLATETPLTRALYELLPGFGLFRMPIRFVYLTGFCGIVLAGIGFDETAALLRARRISGQLASTLRALPLLLLTLISAEGVFYAHRYVRTEPVSMVVPDTEYAEMFAGDESVFRIAPLFRHTVQPGWAAPMKLQLVTGYLPFNLEHYRSYFELLTSGEVGQRSSLSWADLGGVARWDMLDALNVKYIVSHAPLDRREWAGITQVARLGSQPMFVFFDGMKTRDIYVYRNESALGRAFWARRLVAAVDESESIRLMRQHDLRTTAVVFSASAFPDSGHSFEGGAEDRVVVQQAAGGFLELRTHSQGRRFLTISEVWHPGWRAFLDGDELPLERCNLALMGAWVPAGDHRLVLRFRPIYWRAAVGVSLVSLFVLVGMLVAVLRGSQALK